MWYMFYPEILIGLELFFCKMHSFKRNEYTFFQNNKQYIYHCCQLERNAYTFVGMFFSIISCISCFLCTQILFNFKLGVAVAASRKIWSLFRRDRPWYANHMSGLWWQQWHLPTPDKQSSLSNSRESFLFFFLFLVYSGYRFCFQP